MTSMQPSKQLLDHYEKLDVISLERIMNYQQNILTGIKDILRNKKDIKYILILPPELSRYLEWRAEKTGEPKAVIMRTAVEKTMEHDLAYKAHVYSGETDD